MSFIQIGKALIPLSNIGELEVKDNQIKLVYLKPCLQKNGSYSCGRTFVFSSAAKAREEYQRLVELCCFGGNTTIPSFLQLSDGFYPVNNIGCILLDGNIVDINYLQKLEINKNGANAIHVGFTITANNEKVATEEFDRIAQCLCIKGREKNLSSSLTELKEEVSKEVQQE